jgi:hypothetical protein
VIQTPKNSHRNYRVAADAAQAQEDELDDSALTEDDSAAPKSQHPRRWMLKVHDSSEDPATDVFTYRDDGTYVKQKE